MTRHHRIISAALLLAALAHPFVLRFEAQSGGAIVISQVYGGGGNAGATLTNDFIELFNRGTAPVSVNGWSVQYASSAGTTWAVTPLTGTIQPGGYYLVQQAQGAGGTTPLPAPNATGTIAMSATAGKVALSTSVAALSGTCPVSVVDFVGYGTANCFEGSGATPALTNTTAALRADGGCTDTNVNSADFSTGAPVPRNSSSALNVCDGPTALSIDGAASPTSVPQGDALTVTAAVTPATDPASTDLVVTANLSAAGGSAQQQLFDDGVAPDTTSGDNTFTAAVIVPANNPLGAAALSVTVADAQARSATDLFTVTVIPPPVIYLPHDVQGSGASSPFPAGTAVTVQGVVTARKFNGFFIQTAPGQEDADPSSSEGVFIFTSIAAPAAAQVGRLVQVAGTVAEFISSADPGGPPLTELANVASVVDVGPGTVPAPVALTPAIVSPVGAFDQLERFEGMRVAVDSLTAVSGTGGTKTEAAATSTSNGTFYAVLTGTPRPFREAGIESPAAVPTCAAGSGCAIPVFDSNPERLRVDTDALEGLAPLDVSTGAVTGPMTGPLDYGGRAYTILPETVVAIVAGMTTTYVPAPGANQFTVASFNMERFFDTVNDPGGDTVLTADALERRLSKASLVVRNALQTPDILAVEEVEHIGALTLIADRVNADRGLTCPGEASCYGAILQEGNDPGGIDVGFLVKTRVTILETTQWGKEATYSFPDPTPTDPNQVGTALMNDRPSLSIRATLQGPPTRLPAEIIVVVNHLRSLNGIEDPLDGVRVRAKRQAQAEFLAGVLQGLQEAWPNTPIISVGDYNAFDVSDGYVDVIGTVRGVPTPPTEVVGASPDLVGPDFADAASLLLPASDRYSYSFNGNAQTLDHVLVSKAAAGSIPGAAPLAGLAHARINADFPEVLRTDPLRPERLSDHDPVVAYFEFPIVAGQMLGAGTVGTGSNRAAFLFDVSASSDGIERGWLILQSGPIWRPDFLVALQVTSVTFSIEEAVSFAGVGWWNGRPGFMFEATASDRGEPGRNTDTFSIVVRNPSGVVVASVSGTLRDGNIQFLRAVQ